MTRRLRLYYPESETFGPRHLTFVTIRLTQNRRSHNYLLIFVERGALFSGKCQWNASHSVGEQCLFEFE